MSIVAYLVACSAAAWGQAALPAATNLPPLIEPVSLKDADGNAESGFVDPFRRRSGEGGAAYAAPAEDGLLRTTMGEISSEFRILAITIPEDTNTPRLALIQFHDSDEPIVVHEGDLVRVDRLGGGRMRNGRVERPRSTAGCGRNKARSSQAVRPAQGRAALQRGRSTSNSELEEQLGKFVFYVNVKRIKPTYIEVYHNKKRPDETIRLNW